jgi:RNA polymerase sigma-70 factor (ECF subfamily)
MADLDEHVKQCLRGDMDRFEEIVKACEPRVRGILAAMIPDANAVPDLTQEVFIVAYRKLDTYRPGTNFQAWIGTIARNLAQNERRRWYRRQEMQQRYQTEAERRLAEHIEQFVESLPEDVLESLRDCVGRLGDKTRAMVDNYYYGQCSIKHLAELFKLSSSAAKVTLHRARQAVGKCMQRKGQT